MKLRTRVFDLEQQNRILSVLFQQRVKMSANPLTQVTDLPCFETARICPLNLADLLHFLNSKDES